MNELTELFATEAWREQALAFILESGAKGLRLVLILALAAILSRVLGRVVSEVVSRVTADSGNGDALRALESKKRADTLKNVASRTATIVVWAVAIVMALSEVGFDVGPLLAGAGVAGIAVGFGAQNLVRDFFAGFFLLTENQIRVGDVAIINGQGGFVEQLNLRTTVIRDFSGDVHIIPNGAITQLANKTREYSFYVFEIGVAYKEDVDNVMRVMDEVGAALQKDETIGPLILEPIQIVGVDKFADSAVVIKARIKTSPIQQWTVGRAYNRLLKIRFDQEKIEFPFPHRTVFMRNEPGHEDLRRLIREEISKTQLPPGDSV
jgi:moderate conductance mechanosensitive channel